MSPVFFLKSWGLWPPGFFFPPLRFLQYVCCIFLGGGEELVLLSGDKQGERRLHYLLTRLPCRLGLSGAGMSHQQILEVPVTHV